ncbi:MAG: glycosyltransferase family 4 protein [Anaerolineales bacterium]|nr:glycosyltransferase family 4 protein [Anaerolineales bacterium]
MRVVIDARMLLPQMTGVGRYLLGLGRALGDLPGEDRFEMWLQAGLPRDHPVWRLADGRAAQPVSLRQLPIRHMDWRAAWMLPGQLSRAQADLLHYPHFDLPWTASGAIAATIHDLKYIARPDFFPHVSRAKRLVMLAMMAFTSRRARRVIAVSHSTRQDIIRRLHVEPGKVIAIPHGVDERYWQPAPASEIEALRLRYGLGERLILFVGERRPHKNITGLLRAFAAFRRMAREPYQLVIAGKRYADYQEPEEIIESLALKNAVRLLEYVSDEDLPLLYRAADALVLLSYYEGFGLPVLEAMASGAPVVASNVTSLPEVVGQAGLLVSPDDPEQAAAAILKAIPGGALREPCIARGLERASQFTWEECARRTVEVYRQAISE